MNAVIPPPSAWSEMQEVRKHARQLGIAPGKAINEYIASDYSKSYVSGIAEAARRARMLQVESAETPPCAS